MPDTSQAEAPKNAGDGNGKDTGPVLVFDDVSIAFDSHKVLENISFSINPGETCVLLGPAGSGKSVLMKIANGLVKPDSGSVKVFGEEITTMSEVQLFEMRRRVGMGLPGVGSLRQHERRRQHRLPLERGRHAL